VNILFVGDVVGRPGRRALARLLPSLRADHQLDLVIANGENAAAGFGITPSVAAELFAAGVDVITMGNHAWSKRESLPLYQEEPRLLRPANFPPQDPGRGFAVYPIADGTPVGVLNLQGRTYMEAIDCPFRVGAAAVRELAQQTPVILVDMHAEATSEKLAMAYMLDGQVSAVIGTHTHVATCDARVSPQGTAYITDVGMTGPVDSILGVQPELVIERFLTRMPNRFEVASGAAVLQAVLLDIDPLSGRAGSISRLEECSDE
jgi:hypothetical protein